MKQLARQEKKAFAMIYPLCPDKKKALIQVIEIPEHLEQPLCIYNDRSDFHPATYSGSWPGFLGKSQYPQITEKIAYIFL